MGGMPAGNRDKRVTLQRALTTKNALNEDVKTWGAIGKRWAEKLDVSDGEQLRAAEVGATITTRWRVLRETLTRTLTPRDRIVFGSVVYEITGIKDLGNVGFELTTTARPDLQP
jgi:head-tail adaptor